MPKKPVKRPISPGAIFDPETHIERRSGKERRQPWQRTDPNDRRSGFERRRDSGGVKASHFFEVVAEGKKAKKKG